MRIYSSVEELRSRPLRSVVDWWNAHADGGKIPARADFDPLDVRDAMPHLLIAEPQGEPLRIRYRLVGTKIVEAVGWDFTGTYLDELLPPDEAAPWIEAYRLSRDARRSVFGSADTPIKGGSYTFEFTILPVRLAGEGVEQFISAEDYFNYNYHTVSLDAWRQKKRQQ